MKIYKEFVRPVLFWLTKDDAEVAHEWAMRYLRLMDFLPPVRWVVEYFANVRDPRLEQIIGGLYFRNPVGLAAGFDKRAIIRHGFKMLGFGWETKGSITVNKELGNPRPRQFRLLEEEGLLNRMKFNNDGAAITARRLRRFRKPKILRAISIAKSPDTPVESANNDYTTLFDALSPFTDMFEVNVSSPNSPGLRDLQKKEPLRSLARALYNKNRSARPYPKKIALKISPDEPQEIVDEILAICLEFGFWLIIGNTTTDQTGMQSHFGEKGGRSGPHLRRRALELVAYAYRKTQGRIVIVGVGGISTGQDAVAIMKAGASVFQILTSLPYEGPLVARNINKELLEICDHEGIKHISEIRGQEA